MPYFIYPLFIREHNYEECYSVHFVFDLLANLCASGICIESSARSFSKTADGGKWDYLLFRP